MTDRQVRTGRPADQWRPAAVRPLVRPRPSASLLAWGIVGLFVGGLGITIGVVQDVTGSVDAESSPGDAWLVLGGLVAVVSVVALTVAAYRTASSVDMLAAARYEDDRAREDGPGNRT